LKKRYKDDLIIEVKDKSASSHGFLSMFYGLFQRLFFQPSGSEIVTQSIKIYNNTISELAQHAAPDSQKDKSHSVVQIIVGVV